MPESIRAYFYVKRATQDVRLFAAQDRHAEEEARQETRHSTFPHTF